MKTNTVPTATPKVRMSVRTIAEHIVAWLRYPQMEEGLTLQAWKDHQEVEDRHTGKLMLVGIVGIHVGFGIWASIIQK